MPDYEVIAFPEEKSSSHPWTVIGPWTKTFDGTPYRPHVAKVSGKRVADQIADALNNPKDHRAMSIMRKRKWSLGYTSEFDVAVCGDGDVGWYHIDSMGMPDQESFSDPADAIIHAEMTLTKNP